MGKKYTTFLTLFTVICITLTGCERENEQTANQGRLNLRLAVDTNVENMVTRATADEETLPDINDFSITVLQNNNVQLSWNKYADFTDGTGKISIGTTVSKSFTYETNDNTLKIVTEILGQKDEQEYTYSIDGDVLTMTRNNESVTYRKQK